MEKKNRKIYMKEYQEKNKDKIKEHRKLNHLKLK